MRNFGNQSFCRGYDYEDYFVTDNVALTTDDELLAVVSGPGDYNSSWNGEIPVQINQLKANKFQQGLPR